MRWIQKMSSIIFSYIFPSKGEDIMEYLGFEKKPQQKLNTKQKIVEQDLNKYESDSDSDDDIDQSELDDCEINNDDEEECKRHNRNQIIDFSRVNFNDNSLFFDEDEIQKSDKKEDKKLLNGKKEVIKFAKKYYKIDNEYIIIDFLNKEGNLTFIEQYMKNRSVKKIRKNIY
jgi:hypothetical protein